MTTIYSLSQLGWTPFFQQQITLEEWDLYSAARVVSHHRSEIELITEHGQRTLLLTKSMPKLTVGDWILLDSNKQFHRALNRLTLFSRKASGSKVASQLIAANVDTLFVVCSLNDDFNLSRIERYLAIAKEAGPEAVVVLTKSDCCEDKHQYIQQVQALDPMLMTEAINALDPNSVKALEPWCRSGKTVALLGSSGVGKSTLVNTLLGRPLRQTAAIREVDSKGRHTTTARSMHLLSSGGILLDTPGMRELQIADCEHGVKQTFADIGDLEAQCRYSNCQHLDEPGCAVKAAIEAGQLDKRRLTNYMKLMREQALNSASLAEKRARDRNLSRYYRSVQTHARQRKKGDA